MEETIVKSIGYNIISIAHSNRDFTCSKCLQTASNLFALLREFSSEEHYTQIEQEWEDITERPIRDCY